MTITECVDLMKQVLKAEANPGTPVGAAKSLRDRLGNNSIATIGEPSQDGKFVLYASSPNRIPERWNGYDVVDTVR